VIANSLKWQFKPHSNLGKFKLIKELKTHMFYLAFEDK